MAKSRKKPKTRGNKYAHMAQPQAELDYHSLGILTHDDICMRAQNFIQHCADRGMHTVLIITGKGTHSERGPVIGPLLRKFLPQLPLVHKVSTARRDRGGEGALEVELV